MISKIKWLVKRVKKSNDSKTLVSNFGYLMLLRVAGYVFPLITIPHLARVIGVEGFGKIAFAAAVIMWFQTVADWGFNYTATRDVARVRNEPEKVSQIFSDVLWARLFLMALSFVMVLLMISFLPYFKDNKTIILVTFLVVPGQILFPDWFFQAMERMSLITAFNLLSKALFTILIFVFVREKSDYILQPLFISCGYLLAGGLSMYVVLFRWRVRLLPPNIKNIVNVIRGSVDVFINNIMPNLYNSFSIVLLGWYGGNVSTGLLDAGSRFVNVAQQFVLVIGRVFFPYLSRRSEKHGTYVLIHLSVAVSASITLYILAPYIINAFFTPEFNSAVIVLRIMALSIIFLSLSNVYGTNFLILHGYERKLRNITSIVSLIGFGLAFPLIYMYDFIGAAITIAGTRGGLGLSIMITALTIKKNELSA